MNTREFRFSASSLKEFQQCGLKFKYGRIDKKDRVESPTHHLWFGTLVHNSIYAAVAEHADKGKTLNLRSKPKTKEALALFDTLFDAITPSGVPVEDIIFDDMGERPTGRFAVGKIKSLGKDNPNITQEELEKGWKVVGKKMVKNGIKLITSLDIVELERKMEWQIDGRDFVGYADVVARDEEGNVCYYDFKTSWSKPWKIEEDLQFFVYSYALRLLLGLDYYPVGYFVHLKSGDPVKYEVTPEIEARMLKSIGSSFKLLEADVFFDDYGGFLCPFCPFRHICYGESAI